MEGAAVAVFEWNTGEWRRMYGKGVAGRVVGASVPSAQLARSRGRNRKSCEYRRQLLSVNVETACVRAHARVPRLHYNECTYTAAAVLVLLYNCTVGCPPARPQWQLVEPCQTLLTTIKPISISVIRVRSIFSTYLTPLSSWLPTLSSHSPDPTDPILKSLLDLFICEWITKWVTPLLGRKIHSHLPKNC